MTDKKPREFWENAPGHSHAAIGIWDDDNGKKAGTTCDLCLRWNEYAAMKKENEELKTENINLYSDLNLAKDGVIEALNERDSLRESLKLAVEALSKIENECACPTPEKCYDYAVETLAKIKAKGGL
jgi:hypothetical protein